MHPKHKNLLWQNTGCVKSLWTDSEINLKQVEIGLLYCCCSLCSVAILIVQIVLLYCQNRSSSYRRVAQRETITELHRVGKKMSEIVKLNKAPESTLYHSILSFKVLGNASDCPRSERPRTSRIQKLINAVWARVTRNPKRSIRRMAREMDVSEPTVKKRVKLNWSCHLSECQPPRPSGITKKKKKQIDSSEDSSQQTGRLYGHS